jgi:nucleotide-binding universal stress UspA family protein
MLKIQTILHPTDFSERSDPAFLLACSLARDHGARLIVLHVIPPPVLVAGGDPVAAGIIEEFLNQQREKLGRLQAVGSIPELEHRLANGDPVEEILRVAAESNCGMIVMGTHGLTGLTRVLMGSVAEGVARESPCPVVIVKAPFSESSACGGSSANRSTEGDRVPEPAQTS